jgi:hypothetical protein
MLKTILRTMVYADGAPLVNYLMMKKKGGVL